jgi:hypothetical protein
MDDASPAWWMKQAINTKPKEYAATWNRFMPPSV